MLNKMLLQGNFVTTPELKQTQTGKSLTSFRLAWSETYKENKTELFINCVAWGNTAEFISKYFVKGSQIIVDGRLLSRSYEDDAGTKKYITELVVDTCHFCGYRPQTNPEQTEQHEIKQNKVSYEQNTFKEDGDLPF